MNERQLYITRPPRGEELYTELQKRTFTDLQRLSGEIWTDYNPSDPGVTVADVANYALTETDYKMDFDLEEYLAGKDGSWTEEMYGLFPSKAVYPSAPVTAEDYRRSILARFPMVENVKVTPDKEKDGWYDIDLRLSTFFQNEHTIEDNIRRFLNRHRNLCEQFRDIRTEHLEELYLYADFVIETGQDATEILVQVYWTVMQYLSGSIEIIHPASDGVLPMRDDEWYEGPVMDIRAEIPEQKNTESELYWKLKSIPGIVSFKTCYLKSNAGHIVTDFKKSYSLHIPENFGNVIVRIDRDEVDANIKGFRERLRARYFMRGTFRMRRLMQEWEEHSTETGRNKRRKTEEYKGTLYRSIYRDLYGHSSLANDLPSCYGTSEKDFLRDTPAGQKAAVRNFGNYLKLFDLLMQRGLNELDGLKRILSIDDTDKEPSYMETLPKEVLAMRKYNDRYRNIEKLRNRYMDFLDGLYGVDSAPEWLAEFDCYGQIVDDRLRRRMRFLKSLPKLVRDRSRSFDLTGTYGGENVPTVKKYLSLLLDFDIDEETTVGNILPGHNLILMGDGEKGKRLRGLMSLQMIDDDVFISDSVEAIKEDAPPATKAEKLKRDEDLKRNLPIFNSNWISGSLFREGITLGNYNLVKLGNNEWLLVFRGKEEKRMNLGRSDSKEKLSQWANTLCRYLCELNRLCEAVYVVEKSLLTPAEPFTVMLVFTGWTARTRSSRFREECTQLARSVIPAHLKIEMQWLGALQMQYFEDGYKKWRESIMENASADIRERYREKMTDALSMDFMYGREKKGTDKEEEKETKKDDV